MRPFAAALLVLALVAAGPLPAQDAPGRGPSGIAVIDQNRLLTDSGTGRGIESAFQAASRELVAENRRIEAALEDEERALTASRPTTPPADFQRLAAEFDKKVEGIRSAQEAKSRSLGRQRDEERQHLIQRALPVLAQLMQERSATVLVDRNAVVLSFGQADITDAAIERLNALPPETTDHAAPLAPGAATEPDGPMPESPAPEAPVAGASASGAATPAPAQGAAP